MNALFERIEAILRGEVDLLGENMVSVTGDLMHLAWETQDELMKRGKDYAMFVIDGVEDVSEPYDDGTEENARAYTQELREFYKKVKAYG